METGVRCGFLYVDVSKIKRFTSLMKIISLIELELEEVVFVFVQGPVRNFKEIIYLIKYSSKVLQNSKVTQSAPQGSGGCVTQIILVSL